MAARFPFDLLSRCAAAAAVCLLAGGTATAASSQDPNWPCMQRKVPEISAGMVWSGPPIDQAGRAWEDDPAVAALVRKAASRRTSMEDAASAIDGFARAAGAEKARKLTLLFAGILDSINHDRSSIIAGIQRYSEKQKALADKIEHQAAELAKLPANGTPEQQSDREDLTQMQTWDTRIFDEREHALTYVCEQPVLLEQRAFALGREIMQHME